MYNVPLVIAQFSKHPCEVEFEDGEGVGVGVGVAMYFKHVSVCV